jgi:hypothetical protein
MPNPALDIRKAYDVAKELEQTLGNQEWRMNNLYYIVNKNGDKVLFKMSPAQQNLFRNQHTKNIIVKARQLGFSTLICLYFLDCSLFNSNLNCGIIAHTENDAKKLFATKIKFPYDNIPQWVKDLPFFPKNTIDSVSALRFDNGSQIEADTNFRGGTLQKLLASEYAKVCADNPQKAVEIITGAIQAVAITGSIFIESTAGTADGKFFEYADRAKKLQDSNLELTNLDYKLFFENWINQPDYFIDNWKNVLIKESDEKYFEKLETDHQINLTEGQKAWYVKNKESLGHLMKKEYPSYFEEAFESVIEGSILRENIQVAREADRIGNYPHIEGEPVHIGWDMGKRDCTVLWFFQVLGNEIRFIDFYINSQKYAEHYAKIVLAKPYRYGTMAYPHDAAQDRLNGSYLDAFYKAGLGRHIIIPKLQNTQHGVNTIVQYMPYCTFHEKTTSQGIQFLENWQYTWDRMSGKYTAEPYHDDKGYMDTADSLRHGLSFAKNLIGKVADPRRNNNKHIDDYQMFHNNNYSNLDRFVI